MQASNQNNLTNSDIKDLIDHCKDKGILEFKYNELYFRLAPHVPDFPQTAPSNNKYDDDTLLFMSSK